MKLRISSLTSFGNARKMLFVKLTFLCFPAYTAEPSLESGSF